MSSLAGGNDHHDSNAAYGKRPKPIVCMFCNGKGCNACHYAVTK